MLTLVTESLIHLRKYEMRKIKIVFFLLLLSINCFAEDFRIGLGIGARDGVYGMVFQNYFFRRSSIDMSAFGFFGIGIPTVGGGFETEYDLGIIRFGLNLAGFGMLDKDFLIGKIEKNCFGFALSPAIAMNIFSFDVKLSYVNYFFLGGPNPGLSINSPMSFLIEVGYRNRGGVLTQTNK